MLYFLKKTLFFLLCLLAIELHAQKSPLQISRYAYGDFLKDDRHHIEIFNASDKTLNLSNYWLITRYYALRFPSGTSLAPLSSLNLGKSKQGGLPTDKLFTEFRSFLIRFPNKEVGDYAVLMDANKRLVDAFYFSPTKPRFLPDKGELILDSGEKLGFEIPDTKNEKWKHLDLSPDPAMLLVRIGEDWKITSKSRNLFPATEYADLEVFYSGGIVSLKWHTLFEEDCFFHRIERSTDGKNFKEIGKEKAGIRQKKQSEYYFYDKDVSENQRYIYRIKTEDKFRNLIYSYNAGIETDAAVGDFDWSLLDQGGVNTQVVALRIATRTAQYVRIRILDEQMRERDILFEGEVAAAKPYLLKYDKTLAAGKYYLIAETQQKRYHLTLKLEN